MRALTIRRAVVVLGLLTLLAVLCALRRYQQRVLGDAPVVHRDVSSRQAAAPVVDGDLGRGDPAGNHRTNIRVPSAAPAVQLVTEADTDELANLSFDHPALTPAMVMAMHETLKAAASSCATGQDLDVSISAAVTLEGRDILLEGLGCHPAAGVADRAAAEYCACLLSRSMRDAHALLPDDGSEDDLYYQGQLVLEHWGPHRS